MLIHKQIILCVFAEESVQKVTWVGDGDGADELRCGGCGRGRGNGRGSGR